MSKKRFKGLFPATFTPFKKNGEVDYETIEPYMDFLKKNKVKGIFLNGTSGEAYSISTKERKKLLEVWMDYKKEDFAILVHVSHLCFKEAKELAAHAQDCGADGFSTMGTLYFQPNSVGDLVENTSEIAKSAPELPYFYYHIPGMSRVEFPMRDFTELAIDKIPNFAGLKFSTMDLMDFANMSRFLKDKDGVSIFSGYDQIMLQFLCFGAHASVGTTFNFAAPLYLKIRECFKKRDLDKAMKYQRISAAMIEVLEDTNNFLAAAKYMMKIIGFDVGEPRLPVHPLSTAQKERLRKRIQNRGIPEYYSQI